MQHILIFLLVNVYFNMYYSFSSHLVLLPETSLNIKRNYLAACSYLCEMWMRALPLSKHLNVWILAKWMKARQSELIASYCLATTININNIHLTQLLMLEKFKLQILVSEPCRSHINFLNLNSHFWATCTPQVLQLLSLYLFTLFYCHQNPEF